MICERYINISHGSYRDFCIGLHWVQLCFKVIWDFWLNLLGINLNFKEFGFRV